MSINSTPNVVRKPWRRASCKAGSVKGVYACKIKVCLWPWGLVTKESLTVAAHAILIVGRYT